MTSTLATRLALIERSRNLPPYERTIVRCVRFDLKMIEQHGETPNLMANLRDSLARLEKAL
jgi:hypothetical protein